MTQHTTTVQYKDKTITLIGTAHVSNLSAIEVEDTIKELKPDTICIELDPERYENMKNPKKWEESDIVQIIKEHKEGYMLVNILLAAYQKRIANSMNSKTGNEMSVAIKEANESNANLVMIDRDVQTTFKRIFRKHSFFQKIGLLASVISSLFDEEEVTEEELEKLKESETLEAALQDVTKDFPIVAEVLIDERNRILAHNIQKAPGKNIVAVVGAAHIPGILQYIQKEDNIDELMTIPPKSLSSKIISWAIPIAIISLIILMFFRNPNTGINQIKSWILWNGSLSAIGTLIARGHPLSILTAFIAAPITSLNPLLAAGWFAGLVEAMVRKPKVKDAENLAEDCATLKGFLKNGITRILLIVILANVFSTIGTFIGGLDIIKNFFNM